MPCVNVDFLVNNTVVAGMNVEFTFTYLSKNPVRMNMLSKRLLIPIRIWPLIISEAGNVIMLSAECFVGGYCKTISVKS